MLRIALAVFLLALPARAQDASTITVSVTGNATAKPDMATLRLGVRREADTARAALDAANEAMSSVLDAMREAGIADRDLQTSDLGIRPIRDERSLPQPDRSPVTGYVVTNTLTVRVRDIARAGAILDRAVTLGVNTDGGISFSNADPEPITDAARRDAVEKATRQARTLAEAANVRLGALRTIQEGGGGRPRFAARARSMAESVPIAPGESTYSVSVTMEWAIEATR